MKAARPHRPLPHEPLPPALSHRAPLALHRKAGRKAMQPPVSSHQAQSARRKNTRPSRRSQFLKTVSDESSSPDSPPAPPRTASSSALTSRAFGASQKKPEERQCSRLYRPIKLKAPRRKKRAPSRRSQSTRSGSDESRSPSPPAPPRTASSSAPASRIPSRRSQFLKSGSHAASRSEAKICR